MSARRNSVTEDLESIKRNLTEKLGLRRMLGKAAVFTQVKEQIPRIARCDVTVLITGETGTGKELCARAIHYLSDRSSKPFLPLNCGTIPGGLFENELFGHHRGAFTDAHAFQPGMIAEAEGGTLFLDEVECLSASAQAKLLRFLEEKRYKRLGCSRYVESDVRILAATNENLQQKMQEKNFRDDLFYRLHVVHLDLPPLRDRKEDIPILTEYFMEKYCTTHNNGKKTLSPRALQKLYLYDWPGNIRELENRIQQAVVMAPGPVIRPRDLKIDCLSSDQSRHGRGNFKQAKAKLIEQFEKSYVSELLIASNGNVSKAAREAGLDRWTFSRIMKKYGIDRTKFA